ncbi:fumarylacetoacetate hydrolase family protein [Pigmentiphaga litoralis]|uniref:2-keto-4-pentenoate hydratase/2-oxohepta-3-ene-1,7-dioic acid hydratase in catechol pathway n=1 Tax=Pigmentiphaga litoralis TaxID=516702 RepID=A0A7Y9ISX6_9BURK|nr:fumarylacetoacetate hydrolase family protein [Pigmentiphaga litoralis]NYE24057.1 2-keto-4-pentenoate hydratase/2-oxohepta-3-ene-1,7-dioic acid hydratase in catechol pathway [Pigmentiphaga litoralis]NYE82329.1 2-keto-4-pentenoate hydratase/2-oxohepta-3-ene-1,7-dioic acid hydratase in catechol pathway [Pigmentiphaga litoralis]
MKLASVQIQGRTCFGAIVEGGFIDLSARFAGRCHSLADLLRQDLVHEARRLCAAVQPDHPLTHVEYLPLIPDSGARVFALGVAYKDHLEETGRASQESPSLFTKHRQSLVGHEQPILKPRVSDRFDFEGEIVLVIGKAGRHIPEAEAMSHVAGYSILMDGSVRDYQKHSVTAGKNFDRSSAFGPWMVTADAILDPGAMRLTTTLNGSLMQSTTFERLMWTPAAIVHYVSTFTELQPGDAISTGTPAGVGHRRTPPVFMKAGDRLEVAVSGIGVLANTVQDE